jgi:hypothetical protein
MEREHEFLNVEFPVYVTHKEVSHKTDFWRHGPAYTLQHHLEHRQV